MVRQLGRVDIVGAGPGDPTFLTLGAFQLLSQAEVLIYDALIDPILLTWVEKSCYCLAVGKRGGQPSTPQSQIDQCLVEHCQAGHRVVRLKGGDPFMFGRTTSEVLALRAAGCRVQVWPGLSSVMAAPLLAGIPLTDAQGGRQVLVLSGHEPTQTDWAMAAAVDTLVMVMATHHLAEIIACLRAEGRAATCPIAVIQWAGWPQQRVWVGTLEDILVQLPRVSCSPAVVVIGAVVGLRAQLGLEPPATGGNPRGIMGAGPPMAPPRGSPAGAINGEKYAMGLPDNTALPLAGRTILVTRAASQAGEFCEQLRSAGAMVLEQPALDIGPPSDWGPMDRAIANLSQFDWLILTSANGVEFFCDRVLSLGLDLRALSALKIAVVGRKTAKFLRQRGLQADFIPPDYVADALVEHFPGGEDLHETRILFPRVESGGRAVLVAAFTARGATVVEVPAYESRCPRAMEPAVLQGLRSQSIDVITFASSKTVRHFHQLLQQAAGANQNGTDIPDWHSWLVSTQLASIGPQTSQACQACWGRVDLEAQEYTLDGLYTAILKALTSA